MLKKAILFLFYIALVSCKTENQKAPTNQDSAIYQSIIDSIYKEYPSSIGIIAHIESPKNGISWSGSAGYSNIEKTEILNANQPALIASNVKTYVSASILRLQEDGKLTIEDPIANHLTSKTNALFKNAGYDFNQIKIKHLLSHTSGIADYVNDDYFKKIDDNQTHRWTRDEQLQLATKVGQPLGAPQELFQYADVNYLLATEIIEQTTQKPFYTAMNELLKYKTLGFKNTWFPTLEDQPKNIPKLVHQYWNEIAFGPHKLDIAWDSHQHDISWDLYGGGGIATTMKELAQFSYQLANGNIIKNSDVLELLTTDVATKDGQPKTYRLGISDTKIKELRGFAHGGFWGTIVFYIPKLDASISVCVLERNNKMKPISAVLNALTETLANQKFQEQKVITENYTLYKAKNTTATLVLFPGGGADAQQTKEEFDIVTLANASNISVLMMNFNRHLWIDQNDSQQLAQTLNNIFSENELNTQNVVIGGMSIGGNVALSLSNYLVENKLPCKPKGVFVVDSPIDLYALYESSIKDIENPDFSEERLAEPKFIVSYFNDEFGGEDAVLSNIQDVSPFTLKTQHLANIESLKDIKLNLYTEPDKQWWKTVRNTDFESTNAYSIQQMYQVLKAKDWNQVNLIETQNKGYRANGERHPHSWSIVDKTALINWMLQ